MIEIKGKANIVVKILADSISKAGIRLVTYEITYPRIIHSELLTHGMLVRNAASSRAIPFAKMVEQLEGRPVRFGQANPGMQDKGEDFDKLVEGRQIMWEDINGPDVWDAWDSQQAWDKAKEDAIFWSKAFFEAGYHKQVYNRLTEPFQMMKTVLSCTEGANFFWLRNHNAADPTLEELAKCMYEAREASTPRELKSGQWHLPYVEWIQHKDGIENPMWKDENGAYRSADWETLKKISSARCAAVSFRNEDYNLAKCLEVYERLIGDDRKHASAFQHQATPMQPCNAKLHRFSDQFYIDKDSVNLASSPETWEQGISHVDRKGQLWSAQFKGWIMNRKLIPGENYEG